MPPAPSLGVGGKGQYVTDVLENTAGETSGEREPQFFALGEVFGGDWTTTDHRLGVQKQARGANLHTMTYATHIACDCICSLAVVVSAIGTSLGAHSAREAWKGILLGHLCSAHMFTIWSEELSC